MKQFALALLLLLSLTTWGQKLKERIQGGWVCIKILDSKGQPVSAKFGEPTEYLKFSFLKSKMSITESPFDDGLSIPIVFIKENSFDWLPGAVYEVPERIYYVKRLDEKYLILSTKSPQNDSIYYHFVNQNQFPPKTDHIVDLGAVVIKHVRQVSEQQPKTKAITTSGVNRVFEYKITNDSSHLFQGPTFKDPRGGTFGNIFSFNFKLPANFEANKISDELILDFEVSEKGAENLKIIKGLGAEIDSEVVRVMEKHQKSWRPIIINDVPLKATFRIHFYFYMV